MNFDKAVELANQISNHYYPFLRSVVSDKASNILELGTLTGGSAHHLATGHPCNRVITVDISASFNVEAYGLDNIVSIVSSTRDAVEQVKAYAPFDVLFIDSEHTYQTTWDEYVTYRQFVRDGGLILFDDTAYSDEMKRFWACVPERKESLDWLHIESGFGIVEKCDETEVSL